LSEVERVKYDTESAYKIDNGNGENFVYTKEGINLYPTNDQPSDYNIATLHMLNERATRWIQVNNRLPTSSPYERLKGMSSPYQGEFWHPSFDEREYDVRSPLCNKILHNFLDSFNEITCRSAVTRFYPGTFLSPHIDIGPDYVVRTQTPVITNDRSIMGFRRKKTDPWEIFRFEQGYTYFVNTGWEHFARNDGTTTRIQIRVLTKTQNILKRMEPISCNFYSSNWENIYENIVE
jgi:hypothetical protein